MKKLIKLPFVKQLEYKHLPRPDKLLLIGIFIQWKNYEEEHQHLDSVNHVEIQEITGDDTIDLRTLSSRKWRLLLQFGLIRIDNTITFIINKKTELTTDLSKEGAHLSRIWNNKGKRKICQKNKQVVRKSDENVRKSVPIVGKVDENVGKPVRIVGISDKDTENTNTTNRLKPSVHPNFSGPTTPKFIKKNKS